VYKPGEVIRGVIPLIGILIFRTVQWEIFHIVIRLFERKSQDRVGTHYPLTHPLGFLGGWVVEKTQKNPLLCKNLLFGKKFKLF
jgi:hypothetical protein